MRHSFMLLALLAVGATAFAVAQDSKPEAGHCAFNLKNQWTGPLKACMDPATPAQCASLGTTDENSSAVHGAGQCPTANVVGTCKKSDSALHYYAGEASGLEVGCGFQGGEWSAGK